MNSKEIELIQLKKINEKWQVDQLRTIDRKKNENWFHICNKANMDVDYLRTFMKKKEKNIYIVSRNQLFLELLQNFVFLRIININIVTIKHNVSKV